MTLNLDSVTITAESLITAHGIAYDLDTNTGYEAAVAAECSTWEEFAQRLAEELAQTDFLAAIDFVTVAVRADDWSWEITARAETPLPV